jgi:two-component system chemotaxis response regulator CheB
VTPVEIHTEPDKRGGKTVLVVEDNATVRKMIADAFLSDGFKTCVGAQNGKEGVEVAKQIEPDVITLDFLMPLMNGLEAASELRKLFPKMPMILFTLYSNETLETEAVKAGINLVIAKNAPLPTLVERAHELMGD